MSLDYLADFSCCICTSQETLPAINQGYKARKCVKCGFTYFIDEDYVIKDMAKKESQNEYQGNIRSEEYQYKMGKLDRTKSYTEQLEQIDDWDTIFNRCFT